MIDRRAIPDRVRKILPLLDSTVDGEALGAVRAAGRILKGAGLSYRDLALAIPVHEPGPYLGGDNAPYRPAAPRPWRRERRVYTPKQEARQRAMARYCRDHDRGRLSQRERQFVWDIANLSSGLTIRQGDWLSTIADRLGWEDATWWQ